MLIILITGCGKARENDNDFFEESYSISYVDDPIDFYKFSSYDGIFSNVRDGLVLFTRVDCEFCVDTFSQLSTFSKSDFPVESIFVLQTEDLTDDEKNKIFDTYKVDAVPSFIYLKGGKRVYTRIGALSTGNIAGFKEDIKKLLEDNK